MAMTPGTYLRLRREAAGTSIDDVVAMLPTEPRVDAIARAAWLRGIEADEAPIGAEVIKALRYAFAFDARVLRWLADLRSSPGLLAPRLCRKCACSEFDPCDGGCWWVAEDLCSSCPVDEPGEAAQPGPDDVGAEGEVPHRVNDAAAHGAAA